MLPGSDDDVAAHGRHARRPDVPGLDRHRGRRAGRRSPTSPGSRAVAGRRRGDGAGRGGRRGRPRDLVVVLEPGDRVEPDLVFNRVATGLGRPARRPDPLGRRRRRPLRHPRRPPVPAVVVAGDAAVGQLPRPVLRHAPRPARRRPGRPAPSWATPPVGPPAALDLDGRAGRPRRPGARHRSAARDGLGAEGAAVVQAHLDRVGRAGAVGADRRRACGCRGRSTTSRTSPSSSRPATTGRCSRPACPAWPGPTTRPSTWSIVDNGGRTRRERGLVRRRPSPASTSRCAGGTDAVQLLRGQQRRRAADAQRRRAGLPQRRHRAARPRLDDASWSAGRAQPEHRHRRPAAHRPRRHASSTAASILGHERLRRPPLRGHGARATTRSSARPTGTATSLAVTGACVAVERELLRRARRLRRAVHPVRQRRRARPRRAAPGPAQRLLAVRRRAPPRVGDPGHRRAARGLLRQLLALQHVAVRRRPVLLAEPVARQPGAGAARRATSRRPRQRVSVPLGRNVRRRSGRRATRPSRAMLADMCRALPSRRAARSTALHAAQRRAVRRPDGQLVHPRHRQPVLRRHQHRAAHRRPPGPRPRRREPLRRRGGSPTTTSSARRWPPRSRRWPTPPIVFYDGDAAPRCDGGAGGRRRDRHAVGDGVRGRALRRTRSGSST